MKTMKKICYLIIMCMFLYTSNANASYAYQWNIDGENLSKGQTNKNGTASWIEDDKYTGGILVLNNYNGGEIKLERIGTGLNHVFAIKLIGDNKIIAKGEEGIITNASELIFIGDGQLTINAKKPITGGKVDNNLFLNTNIVIGSLNETSNDKTIDLSLIHI